MTADLDKAIRAGCDASPIIMDGASRQPIKCRWPNCSKFCPAYETVTAALRSLAEPSEEAVRDMRLAMQEIEIPMKIDGSDRRWLARLPDVVSLAMARAAHATYIRHILGDPDDSS